ncbi:MAG: hypothetical protein AUK54_02885 [Helicobacteraceae bacterium CG2_30_36_10]|nr:MAG: hypothetical protein AUK54_02885 [Helicobacteraceae bacterium CG2_30_36_10]
MRLYLLFLLPLSLLGVELSTLIEYAKNNHTSLKTLQQRVSAVDNEYAISRNFADPVISLSLSDIQFKDPTNRSLEPMQYSAISFAQRIPYFGKRDANSAKVEAKKEKISLTLDALKVKLVEGIKITAYSIWQIEEELSITKKYMQLTRQNIELYSALSSTDSKSHMSIMSAEMALSELKIKKSRLESALSGFYKKLSYLCAVEVKNIELVMAVQKPKDISFYTQTQSQNLSYKVKEATLKEADEDIKVKELASYIDPVVQLGYYHREAFEDYANIGISFSLPIYSTQKSQTQISRKLALASQAELSDFENLLEAEIAQSYAKLESSYKIYDIIQNQSMPQIEHMFELSSSSIKSGEELFLYIDLLVKKLSLDEKNIATIADYYRELATLDALIGETK